MENSKALEILISLVITILSAIMAWVLVKINSYDQKISLMAVEIQALKTNYVAQFGEVKLKIEESKNLFIQENTTTRHSLRNDLNKMQSGLYQDFLLKEDCQNHHLERK
jgi:hypothetical protein